MHLCAHQPGLLSSGPDEYPSYEVNRDPAAPGLGRLRARAGLEVDEEFGRFGGDLSTQVPFAVRVARRTVVVVEVLSTNVVGAVQYPVPAVFAVSRGVTGDQPPSSLKEQSASDQGKRKRTRDKRHFALDSAAEAVYGRVWRLPA